MNCYKITFEICNMVFDAVFPGDTPEQAKDIVIHGQNLIAPTKPVKIISCEDVSDKYVVVAIGKREQ